MSERFKVTAASTNSSYGTLEDGKDAPDSGADGAAQQPEQEPPEPTGAGPFGPTTYVHQKGNVIPASLSRQLDTASSMFGSTVALVASSCLVPARLYLSGSAACVGGL